MIQFKKNKRMIIISLSVLGIGILFLLEYFHIIPETYYSAEDFGITVIYSEVDYNRNGVDDYTDFVLGARKDAKNHPTYDGSYYEGGYPPENIGVCSDVIWRAFKNAGYSLKDMVDNDISNRLNEYPYVEEADPNIDFRRVRNLKYFFEEYAISLTTDIEKIEEWQPGDIVIFGNNKHIGIISDRRDKNGKPYVIHNGGQIMREERNYWERAEKVTGHYRFDASKISHDILREWSHSNLDG